MFGTSFDARARMKSNGSAPCAADPKSSCSFSASE